MDKIQAEQTLKGYLADETKLYQDWYNAFYPPEGDTDLLEFAHPLSLNALKNLLKKQWFEQQRDNLRQIICEKWGYAKKKAAFKNKQALINANC